MSRMNGGVFVLVLLVAVSVARGTSPFPDGRTPVRDVVFVAFDTETTGLVPAADRVIEIGAVRFMGCGEVLAATNWLVQPHQPIPPQATAVHGMTDAMLEGAPDFDQVWPAFEAFCRDAVLLAHQASFDVRFLQAELHRAGYDPPSLPVLDTLALFRKWFPEAPSHALERLVPFFGLAGDLWHRALADSFHIVSLFSLGMEQRPDLCLDELLQDAGRIRMLDGEAP